jgi:hypothetical protein
MMSIKQLAHDRYLVNGGDGGHGCGEDY